MSNGSQPECPTGSCGYGAQAGGSDCNGGDSSCANAKLDVPNQTNDYFTVRLQKVSNDINRVLAGLSPDPAGQGRKLSFLRTPLGVTVGWVNHPPDTEQQGPIPGQVRADNPGVINALMIDTQFSQGDQTAEGKWTHQIANGQVTCSKGNDATCWIASFLVALPNAPYQPQNVQDAVVLIQGLMHGLSNEANGRKLVLMKTNDGMMLAWAVQQQTSAAV